MDILVIGGIAAGASVANKAKRTNPEANITIIEKENYVSFGACGLPYYIGEQFEDSNEMFARSVEKTKETYDKLAICTGAMPIVMGQGSDAENVFTVTRLYDADRLKQTLEKSEN